MINIEEYFKSQVDAELSKIKLLTLCLVVFLVASSFVVKIQVRAVLEDAHIYNFPEPSFYYANKELNIKKYFYSDGDKVSSGSVVFTAINNDLIDKIELLKSEIDKLEDEILSLSNRFVRENNELDLIVKNEEIKNTSNTRKIRMLIDTLKQLKIEKKIITREYNEQSDYVDNIRKQNLISKDQKLKYKNDLLDNRKELLELEKQIYTASNTLENYKRSRAQYMSGLTESFRKKSLIKELEESMRLAKKNLKIKNIELNQLSNRLERLQGVASEDGKIEFSKLNGIRIKKFSKDALIYTIYPEGQHFVTKGFVSEKNMIGIKKGQTVEIKVNAFNYLHYGTIKGVIKTVMGVNNGRVEVIIDIIDKKNIHIVHGNSTEAFIIVDRLTIYEYIFTLLFPYIS